MTTEMTQQGAHDADVEQPLVAPIIATPQQAGVVKRGNRIKPIIALFQLALAVVLFGLLAYQAHAISQGSNEGNSGEHQKNGTGTNATQGNVEPNVGGNGAGNSMFLFGLLFAVLQAVTAYTMWTHLAFYLPHVKHSSVVGPLKVTAAVGFIAMGFACRHINLGAREDTSMEHLSITHAIEAFIIINWFFTVLVLLLSMYTISWDCETLEDHKITRRVAAAYIQIDLSIILIGLLAGYYQLYTEGIQNSVIISTDILLLFAILFAVLQAISGCAMLQQCGIHTPGQMGETVSGLLKVVNSFGVIAFGFACRSIYITTHTSPLPSAHLIAIQSFVIINFLYCLFLATVTNYNILNWDNQNTTVGKRKPGTLFGALQTIFAIVLFGLLAGMYEKVTGGEKDATDSLNAAGEYMLWFGLLFSVLQFFAGLTMLESGSKKFKGLNPSSVSVTNKVALAIGALAFGFACRHINLFDRKGQTGGQLPLVHAIESFIIINFFLTWFIDVLSGWGKIEW